jgi:hypothetical protein
METVSERVSVNETQRVGTLLRGALRTSLNGRMVDIKEIDISNGYIPGCRGDSESWSSRFTVKMFKFDPKTHSGSAIGELHVSDSDRGSKDIPDCTLLIKAKTPMNEDEFIEGVRKHSMKDWHEKFSYHLLAWSNWKADSISEKGNTVEINYMGDPVS